jgi:hypothetical protein
MNQTDKQAQRSTELSRALFDEVLVPLAKARREAGAAPYFPAWREEKVATYFERSGVSRMSPADFEFPGGGTAEGLIDSLTAFWRAEGEAALAGAGPRLRAIADALREEAAAQDGDVDIFCYTLF